MNILEYAKIIGAEVEFRGNFNGEYPWCNVSLRKGTESARTIDEGPLFSFGRDESKIPNPNVAGEELVGGIRGRIIAFTSGVVRDNMPQYHVPEDLEWGIKIGEIEWNIKTGDKDTCLYCDGEQREIPISLPQMSIKGNTLVLSYEAFSTDSSFFEEVDIAYCPFCGRKLG